MRFKILPTCIIANVVICISSVAQTTRIPQTHGDPSLNTRAGNGMMFTQNNDKQTIVKKEQIQQWMRIQPVRFLENRGQMTDVEGKIVPFVLFKAQSPGMDMYITEKGLTYVFIKTDENEEGAEDENRKIEYTRIDMSLHGANLKRENIIREKPSEADFNYFYGHCPNGIYGVKEYEKITIKNIYEGIDWVLYNSTGKGFKYDFIIHPGTDPQQIELIYSSLKPLTLNRKGDIEIKTELGNLTENTPVSFQNEKIIETKFIKTLNQKNENGGYNTHIKFDLGSYDHAGPLTIDPQLVWGTFFGGNSLDSFTSVSTDNNGNVLVTGYTMSTTYPLQNTGSYYYQSVLTGDASGVLMDVIILKFTNNGNLLWSTFYGGASCTTLQNGGLDDGQCIGSDLNGNIYITGITGCSTFPTQNMTGAYYQAAAAVARPFILKFNSAGTRLWATTFGNSLTLNSFLSGRCKYLVIDPAGNLFICGTGLNGLPTANPGSGAYIQAASGGNDMFFSKFNPAGVLIWSTYFGGSSYDIATSMAVDNSGNIYATGSTQSSNFPLSNPGGVYFDNTYNGTEDAAIIKFSNNGNLLWSTYFGGNDYDRGWSITCDLNGNVLIAGTTMSTNFPVQNPGAGAYFDNSLNNGVLVEDWFVAKFTNTYSLFWSTYYGGGSTDRPSQTGSSTMQYGKMGISSDNCGNIYVTGGTASVTDFPILDNPVCNNYNSTYHCAVVLKFSSSGVRLWANGLRPGSGSNFGQALTVDKNNNLFVVGEWNGTGANSLANPGAGAYYQSISGISDDGFIVKFIPTPPTFSKSLVNATGCSCNGSATINLTSTCSTPPYNYMWSNGSQTLNTTNPINTITGSCPGNYWVKISDAGCYPDTILYYTITGGNGSLSVSSTQNSGCNTSCTHTSTITASGGTVPYTYLWSNAQTAQTATGLCPGSYSVEVTDANNCTSIHNIIIPLPQTITVGFGMQLFCPSNVPTAAATAFPVNGVSPYIYSWSNGQTTATATGLLLGTTFTVTITDANGCTRAETYKGIIPPPLAVVITSLPTSCGLNNGSTNLNNVGALEGGIPPYNIVWSTGAAGTNNNFLSGGTYTVTVTDGMGCSSTSSAVVASSTSPVSATFTKSPGGTICIGTTVNFTNTGTPPGSGITYNWVISPITPANVSGTTTNFSYAFLSAGKYAVTHTVYGGGCSIPVTDSVTVITCSAAPTVTATGNSICPGSCAAVTSAGAGGTSPYTYSWNTGATTQNINPCPASTTTYTVTIKDTGGNTSTATALVTVNPAVSVVITSTNISCSGSNDGTALANPGSGISPYTYTWSVSGGSGSGFQISGLTAGTYTVTVTDNKGCTCTSTAVINSPQPLMGQFTKGTANCLSCGCKEWLIVTGMGGTSPYSYNWPDGYVNRYKNQLCPGAYSVNIKDKNGCSVNLNLTAP